MGNKFYQPGIDRAARVNVLFDSIAVRYDLINDLQSLGLHRHWKRRLIDMAEVVPGELALDLCCGTGDIAFALAGRGARVIGLDFSHQMLGIAMRRFLDRRQSISQADLNGRPSSNPPAAVGCTQKISFVRADALRIPFADSAFDIATIGYGLRNLAVMEDGLIEMNRVIKPGGRLLVLDFGKPANALWRGLYFAYLRCLVPVYGKVFCGDADAYGYILESLKRYPAQDGVAAAMRNLSWVNVRVRKFLGGAMTINYAQKPLDSA